ncbi:MAG: hypothetical protein ABSH47_17230 [Bryobacteraceae bacterium]|jgi:hypothetical protein
MSEVRRTPHHHVAVAVTSTTPATKREPSPADCLRIGHGKLNTPCYECGRYPDVVHCPTREAHCYCREHCPCCAPKGAAK